MRLDNVQARLPALPKEEAKVNQFEMDKLLAEKEYWQKIDALIPGWQLMGWTMRNSATFITHKHWTIILTGQQRDDIVSAIERRG